MNEFEAEITPPLTVNSVKIMRIDEIILKPFPLVKIHDAVYKKLK
jgi:hypothetical protein